MNLHYIFGPMPKVPFSPMPPLSLLPLVWILSEWGHTGHGTTWFLPCDIFPAFYFIPCLSTWRNQQNPSWCQHFSMASTFFWATEDNWDREEVGQSGIARQSSSVFWVLPKSTGSSSLLPRDTHINSQKTLDRLHCRSSALDHKAEHGSWYLKHQQIFSAIRELIKRS